MRYYEIDRYEGKPFVTAEIAFGSQRQLRRSWISPLRNLTFGPILN